MPCFKGIGIVGASRKDATLPFRVAEKRQRGGDAAQRGAPLGAFLRQDAKKVSVPEPATPRSIQQAAPCLHLHQHSSRAPAAKKLPRESEYFAW